MATIHHLDRDSDDSGVTLRAITLHNKFHTDPFSEIPREDFQELYVAIGEVDAESPEEVESSWQDDRPEDARSFDVGDIVQLEDAYFVLLPDGWEPIQITEGLS